MIVMMIKRMAVLEDIRDIRYDMMGRCDGLIGSSCDGRYLASYTLDQILYIFCLEECDD